MLWDAKPCRGMQRDAPRWEAARGTADRCSPTSGTQQRKGLTQEPRTGCWRLLPKPCLCPRAQGQLQAGQAGSHRLGCETAAHGGPCLEVLKSHTPSSEAVGAGDATRGTEGQAAGTRSRGDGAPVTAYTENFKAEITLPDLCSARRDKPPPSASHFPLEGTPGWKLQVSRCYLQRQVSPAKPQEPEGRAGAIAPGPSLRGHAPPRPSRAGNAKIMISFAVGFSSAGERAAGSAVCRGHSASGTSLRMDGHQLCAVKGAFSPQALASCKPRSRPCHCLPAPCRDPPQVFPAGDANPAMIPSFAPDARAEPRDVAQHWCRSVPVAMVCLLSQSSLQAPWSIGWCRCWFPPSLPQELGHGGPHPATAGPSSHEVLGFFALGFVPREQVQPPTSLQWTQSVAPCKRPFGVSQLQITMVSTE